MKYYSFKEQETELTTLSLVYHNLPNEKIKIYETADGKICSVDATDEELATWLEAQVVPMTELDEESFKQKRAQSEQWEYEWKWLKKLRADELEKTVVTINGVDYDANEISMDRIDRILTLANWRYNQAIANGMSPAEAYNAIYKTTIIWKGNDNKFHNIQIESVAKAQEAAISKMKSVWEKYG